VENQEACISQQSAKFKKWSFFEVFLVFLYAFLMGQNERHLIYLLTTLFFGLPKRKGELKNQCVLLFENHMFREKR